MVAGEIDKCTNWVHFSRIHIYSGSQSQRQPLTNTYTLPSGFSDFNHDALHTNPASNDYMLPQGLWEIGKRGVQFDQGFGGDNAVSFLERIDNDATQSLWILGYGVPWFLRLGQGTERLTFVAQRCCESTPSSFAKWLHVVVVLVNGLLFLGVIYTICI